MMNENEKRLAAIIDRVPPEKLNEVLLTLLDLAKTFLASAKEDAKKS